MAPNESECCAVCQIPAKNVCSACKLVKYCTTEHQRKHWKQHKLECRAFKVEQDANLGRHLIATRNIKGGTVIFLENPLIVGPKWYLNESEERVPVMPCVGCFTPCRMGLHECPRCHWPACSPHCEGLINEQLHALECNVLMLGPGPTKGDQQALVDYYRSDALMVLKCLLLQRSNSKKWQELMDMQSHEEERLGSELYKEAEMRIVSFLQQNFLQRLRSMQKQSADSFLREFDANILHRICGIIETNYMCINLASGLELSGLFYNACMMEHSCAPNCYFQFDQRNGFRISVIAGRDIAKNEHLQIMYSNMLWGTQMRQEHLNLTKHFQCRCVRCEDPSEFGTHFSALLCMGDVNTDCGGTQLPTEPLNAKSDWVCDKCPMIISNTEVSYLLTQITNEVETLLSQKPIIQQLENLIEKLSKFLHPNHYHMFSLKHTLIQLYGTQSGFLLQNLSDELLLKKQTLCQELYDICQRLDPYTIRLSIYLGIILYEWHSVEIEQANRLFSKNPEELNSVLANYEKALKLLEQASVVLHKEQDNVAGKKLNETILKSKHKVEEFIKQHKIET